MITIRIYERLEDGRIEDRQIDMGLEDFAGQCPALGDVILEPGVPQHLDRRDAANRLLWTVVGRIFNPRDLPDYIALIVEERSPTPAEAEFVAG